jgi:DNA-binding transcriptional ArsR family regulator
VVFLLSGGLPTQSPDRSLRRNPKCWVLTCERGRARIGGMTATPSIAEVAALVGNPARANVLAALLGGQALTATELAFAAHVSPQTTSGHLADLTNARLLVREKQGRHAYYRLASPLVGRMLEGIMAVAVESAPDHRPHWKCDSRMDGADVLRPSRWQVRRRDRRCPGGAQADRTHRRWGSAANERRPAAG